MSAAARRTLLIGLAAVLALVLPAVAALHLPARTVPSGLAAPGEDSAEVGFARDMSVHHQQAVEMALLLRDRSASADVRLLAYDIANAQAAQRGMMLGWLALWGRTPTSSRPPMAWMRMPPPSEADRRAGILMPGMASREQLRRLATAAAGEADILFLRLTIEHHRGGVLMAEHVAGHALAGASWPEVRRLARTMVTGQRDEIDLMTRMLRERTPGRAAGP
ncbi:DUF305 domain-containing protein [Spirillospora sp. CA-294931]|uniref:DUF305 domain-containing protein n=1 Tax=Spirillospora sp. CA-294931 TaxID=3240042 RepID=UPI003D935DBC